jgi:hypothetical protein
MLGVRIPQATSSSCSRLPTWRVEAYWEIPEATHFALTPLQFVRMDCQFHVDQSLQQRSHDDLCFQRGEGGAGTSMDSVAESEVGVGLSVQTRIRE